MKYVIGIDLGGTAIKFGVVNDLGEILFSDKLPTRAKESSQAVFEQLFLAIDACQQFAKSNQIELVGIGIGTPGIIDETNRIVLGGAENIEGWENLDIATPLEQQAHLPVFVANDANMMGLGEAAFGSGKGLQDIIFLTVGTGIGGAVMIHGALFNGFANRGTELGHIPLIMNGKACSCGATGCLEAYASVTALIEDFEVLSQKEGRNYEQPVNGKMIVDLYHQKDAIARTCMQHHFDYLGRGIAGLINIFSPQQVIIGGGISEAGSFYIEEVRKAVAKTVMQECAVNTHIDAATLGNNAGCLGAAKWALSFL